MRAFGVRAAWLCVCAHDNCHVLTDKAQWPLAKQLAVKLLKDPHSTKIVPGSWYTSNGIEVKWRYNEIYRYPSISISEGFAFSVEALKELSDFCLALREQFINEKKS
jgi:hypothetical protein